MPLSRRNRPGTIATDPQILEESDARRKSPASWRAALSFVCLVVAATLLFHSVIDNNNTPFNEENEIIKLDDYNGVILEVDSVRLMEADGQYLSLSKGKHSVTVSLLPCNNPIIKPPLMRLSGGALVSIPLVFSDGRWKGEFSFPVESIFRLEVQWQNCDGGTSSSWSKCQSSTIWSAAREVDNDDSANLLIKRSRTPMLLFPPGLWLSSQKFDTKEVPTSPSPAYIWQDITKVVEKSERATLIQALSSLGPSLVSKEATPIPAKFFNELSNYELVCFVGSQSAANIRGAFLSIRPTLFPGQRPFKFHYYNMTSFKRPDQHWGENSNNNNNNDNNEMKKKFRKCKIILVSVDELDESELPISHADYTHQVTTFLRHLLKAFPDETFPIWFLTVNKSPMEAPNMCTTSPTTTTTTTSSSSSTTTTTTWSSENNHPCNDALFSMEFPSRKRIQLLDNTDLLVGSWDENPQDVVAVIAMRIFSLVGHQVKTWRQVNHQIGKIDGLHRRRNDGNVVEPNFELIPYDWTAAL